MAGRVLLQPLPKHPFLGIWILVFTVSGSGKRSTGGILQHHGMAARACPEPCRGESPRQALQPHVSAFVFPLFSITLPLPGFPGAQDVCVPWGPIRAATPAFARSIKKSPTSFGWLESIDGRRVPGKAGSLRLRLPAACFIPKAFGNGAGPCFGLLETPRRGG